MERLDTELLIDEVAIRPTIWEIGSVAYANKALKRQAWQQVVEAFAEEGDTARRKAVLGITLQKKWRNIRDTYNKELKKTLNTDAGSSTPKPSTYPFFTRLSFLQKCMDGKDPQADSDESSENLDEDDESPEAKRFKGLLYSHHTEIVERTPFSRRVIPLNSVNIDEDKLYCLSLYKELRRIPEDNRLTAKIKLLNILHRAQFMHNRPPNVPHKAYTTYWPEQQYTSYPTISDPCAAVTELPPPLHTPNASVVNLESDTQ